MNYLLRLTTVVVLFCSTPLWAVAENAAGRWEGSIQIPGRDYPVIVDLDQPGEKDWAGSIIIPGLGIKGTPLIDLVVTGSEISFTIKWALRSEGVGPAKFQASLSEGGVWKGTFVQAGNSAPFSAKRRFQSSPAVVDGVVYTGCRDAQLYALDAAPTATSMPSNKSISLNPNGPLAASNQHAAMARRNRDRSSPDQPQPTNRHVL